MVSPVKIRGFTEDRSRCYAKLFFYFSITIQFFPSHPLCAKLPDDASNLHHGCLSAIMAAVKKPAKQTAKKATPAKCPSCPRTINFFCHFDPEVLNTKENLENTVALWEFFTGKAIFLQLPSPVLEKLSETAFAGDRGAAKYLVELATLLSVRIMAMEKRQPKIMSEIARKLNVWPVIAGTQPGWEKDTQTGLDELGLGKDIMHLDIPFRKTAGHAARQWAKAAVVCVNLTRMDQRKLASSEKAIAEKFQQGNWKRGVEPAWVSETMGLPDFSQTPTTLKQWAVVIKKMIRQQIPDFELRPEWSNQRNSCKAREQDKKGKIQNTILDDIVSALKTIAPKEINQSAENSLPNLST